MHPQNTAITARSELVEFGGTCNAHSASCAMHTFIHRFDRLVDRLYYCDLLFWIFFSRISSSFNDVILIFHLLLLRLGASLASIRDTYDNAWISSLPNRSNRSTALQGSSFWIAKPTAPSGSFSPAWSTPTQTPIFSGAWAVGQPDSHNGDCTKISTATEHDNWSSEDWWVLINQSIDWNPFLWVTQINQSIEQTKDATTRSINEAQQKRASTEDIFCIVHCKLGRVLVKNDQIVRLICYFDL